MPFIQEFVTWIIQFQGSTHGNDCPAKKNRSVRREAMCEHFSVHGHSQQLLVAIEPMTELAEGAIDQEAKDRFSMLLVIADKHW